MVQALRALGSPVTGGDEVNLDDRYALLLARRVPLDAIVVGRAYVIHARNGGIGVAVVVEGRVGYRLYREKFGEHFLFVEYDWAEDPQFGTAIPLRALDAEPPENEEQLLAWLSEREVEHKSEINAAWRVILREASPAGR
jgi:hypothetical protein